eukprot:GHVU01052294.1.p1 GENE.GHVU01052294.1~~GHVU01052294.1.p1  ORF type:complete len:115 (-),score=5.37 GHVU01052294.1:1290-1634(-)
MRSSAGLTLPDSLARGGNGKQTRIATEGIERYGVWLHTAQRRRVRSNKREGSFEAVAGAPAGPQPRYPVPALPNDYVGARRRITAGTRRSRVTSAMPVTSMASRPASKGNSGPL